VNGACVRQSPIPGEPCTPGGAGRGCLAGYCDPTTNRCAKWRLTGESCDPLLANADCLPPDSCDALSQVCVDFCSGW
jgi:hypothetical protein